MPNMVTNRLSQRARRVKTFIGWSAFVLMIATQWEVRPWFLFALSFYGLFFTWQLLDAYNDLRRWQPVVLVGAMLNGLAIFANGGRMPVLGRTEIYRWWQPLTSESRLVSLCDIYFKCSVGDMVILAGALMGLVFYIAGHAKKSTATGSLAGLRESV